jgi:alpha-beta hydrolase superfamily lysophospholipase
MSSLPFIHCWEVAHPRAAVHILHGMSEHGGRYERLARALNTRDINVWAHDHRGHGKNPTPPVGLGHFGDSNGWRAMVDDAWAVSEHMRTTYPGVPLVLFAHSMGSFVGQTLMAERGTAYRGVVLCGTNGPPDAKEAAVRALARLQRSVLGPRSPGEWLDRLVLQNYNRRFAPNRTKFDWLSRDECEVDKYCADPLCGVPLTAQSWFDFLRGKRHLGTKGHLERIPPALPVRVIGGARDPVGEEWQGVRRLLRAFQNAGLSNVSYKFYEGARHELVNETNREEVTGDLIEWLRPLLSG